ncbi:MAG: hypothetical protein M3295_04685 [Chloroflexota bacterium]|nr:hypothetical protein [Chloroflexota bacterium]
MDWVLLRLIHILSGIFWVGGAFTMFLFLQPTAAATGREGQTFMLHLARRRHLTEFVLGAAILTVSAGLILIWRDSNGLDLDILSRPPMLGFAVGGTAALTALLVFVFLGYPATRRLAGIGGRLDDEQRPPTEDEQRTLAGAQATLRTVGIAILILLTIAAASMATARYWSFVL